MNRNECTHAQTRVCAKCRHDVFTVPLFLFCILSSTFHLKYIYFAFIVVFVCLFVFVEIITGATKTFRFSRLRRLYLPLLIVAHRARFHAARENCTEVAACYQGVLYFFYVLAQFLSIVTAQVINLFPVI